MQKLEKSLFSINIIKKSKLERNRSSKSLNLMIHLFLGLFCMACLTPMILTISVSLSDSKSIADFGYTLIPKKATLETYKFLFTNPQGIIDGYKISMFITIVGTILNLFITALIAYPLSRADFRFRSIISGFIFITMIFSGGLVPFYILIVKYLHLKNSLLSLILPAMAAPFNIFLLRVFFQDIPPSLVESAKIDGSSDFNTFMKIVLPLATPALATLGLMIALGYWNEVFNAMLFIEDQRKYPLQLILNNIVTFVDLLKKGTLVQQSGGMFVATNVPTDSVMYATMVIVTAPMLFLFAFLQKYFVKGATVGAVKG